MMISNNQTRRLIGWGALIAAICLVPLLTGCDPNIEGFTALSPINFAYELALTPVRAFVGTALLSVINGS